MLEIIIRSIKDFFDKKILFTSLIPIVIAALFWGVVFFIFHTQIKHFILYIVGHIPFIGSKSLVADTIEAVGGIFIYYELLIMTSVMMVGIIADKVVDRVNNKYYQLEKRGFGTFIGSMSVSIKQNALFFILFVIFIPAMFIPGVNILVNIILWMILIKKPTFYDSIAMIASKDEYSNLLNSNKTKTFLITLLGAALFLVPFFGVFVYILQLLMFANYNLLRLSDMRRKK